MRRSIVSFVCLIGLVVPTLSGRADAITLLTHGKFLRLEAGVDPTRSRGVLRVGRDPELADAPDPTCPTTSSFELGLFTVATNRVVRADKVDLDCTKWQRRRRSWVYADSSAAGGVRKIVYGPGGLTVALRGETAFPAAGPVAYAQAWLDVGERRFHARFHSFERNEASLIVTEQPSRVAADGEARFWSVLWGDDASQSNQAAALDALARAAQISPSDARSIFLTGMLHLYRFGQLTTSIRDADEAARAEIEAAVAAFDAAEPLLWNPATGVGDSRVPGFGGAARYALAIVTGDESLRQKALVDLQNAIAVNAFFNVFDLVTVAQAEPPGSAAFQMAFDAMAEYLADPETLRCAIDQPEICTNAGLAPGGLSGALVLFGDLYAKAGNLDQATTWYRLAAATEANWAFEGLASDRLATVAERVALYEDADLDNDPPLIGAGAEACASCHHRAVASSSRADRRVR
jgi:tetratricopeptide (TPR) repeat protein